MTLKEHRRMCDRVYFRSLLRIYKGRVNQIALAAGIHRSYLYRRFADLGLNYQIFRNSEERQLVSSALSSTPATQRSTETRR